MLRIELGTVKRKRNESEWRNVQSATCGEVSVNGDGPVIQNLCRELIGTGHSGSEMAEVYRNGTLCFSSAKLSDWARGNPSAREKPDKLNSGSRKSQD